ncbi:hypothetical protein ABPG73_018716 [Tetrahymena malaccensis]
MSQEKNKQLQVTDLLKLYYTEELYRLVHQFPRNNPAFLILIVLKYLLLFQFSLSSTFQVTINDDFKVNFMKQFGLFQYLQNDKFVDRLIRILLFINAMLLVYMIYGLFRFMYMKFKMMKKIRKNFNQEVQMKLEECLNEKNNSLDQFFSLMITIQQYIIYFPSIILGFNNLNNNNASYALLSIAILLNLITSDTDYNYEIKLKDYLAKPFTIINFLFQFFVEIFILAGIVYTPEGQSAILSCYFLINGIRSYFFAYFYDQFSQLLNLFTHIALFSMSISVQIYIQYNIPDELLSYLFIIFLPFSYKIASLLVESDNKNLQNNFQEIYEQIQMNDKKLDKIIRLNIFENIDSSKQNEKKYLKLLNLIINKNISKQNKQINSKKESLNQNFQNKQQLLESNISEGQNQQKLQNNNQQTQLFDDVSKLKLIEKNIIIFLKEYLLKTASNKQRSKKNGTQLLRNVFIFLIEISESYRIYFLMYLQYIKSKNMSLKQQQILNSIHNIFLKKRAVIRKIMGRSNPFDCSYLQVINFENKLEQSYNLLRQTINLKLQVLSMMKQKHIISTELIQKIESMQQQIYQLKKNLNYLIQLNDDSLDLLNLQALFLENLSFSEKDINLLQINKYRKKNYTQKYLNRQQQDDMLSSINNSDKFDEKTCIIFASYKDTKTLIINQVSSNFSNIFSYINRDHIYGRSIESLMPLAFQGLHKMYIKEYLEDSIKSDMNSNNIDQKQEQNRQENDQENEYDEETPVNKVQNNQSKYLSEKYKEADIQHYELDTSKMNQYIIFASLNQMFVLPIKIDIRTNEYKESETFGLVAKIKQINEDYQYILFQETDLSVVGLTQQAHETFFPNCNNLQQISLRQIFPFLIGTQNKIKIQETPDQNNETFYDTNTTKKQLHVNMTEDMEYILRQQLKNKLKIKNKFSFIVIQHSDTFNNPLNSSFRSTRRLNRAKSHKEVQSYIFNYVELLIRKIKYKGVNNISYVEIIKMKQLDPVNQAPIILKEISNLKKQNIYSQLFEHPSELQSIIQDLEQNQGIYSYLQFNSFHTQFQQSIRNFTKDRDTPIDFTSADFQKAQQLLLKQQTLGDESTNLEQIKMMSNRIEYDDLNDQTDESSKQTLNQQKVLQKYSEKLQLNQLYQLQNNMAQEQASIQSMQEYQVSNSDLQTKLDITQRNYNFQNIDEQSNVNSLCALPTPQKSSKAINIELVSPNNSYYMNMHPNQQSLAQLSDQNLNYEQIKSQEFFPNRAKENIYLDIESHKEEVNKRLSSAFTPLKISQLNSKMVKTKSFRKNKISNTLENTLNIKNKKQLMRNSYQDNHAIQLYKDKNSKKQKVQDIIYDIASSNSQNSYFTPVKSKLYQIMADESTLKVIQMIKLIGIICFTVMMCITFLQFNQMQDYLSEANQDYEDFGWPTTYSSSLSDILKYKNIQFLMNYTRQNFTDNNQKQLFYNEIQQNMDSTFSYVLELLIQMEVANSNREVFNKVLENKMDFYFGQLYNSSLLDSTQSDSTDLISLSYSANLQYNILLNVQNIFRYINNLGNGRPEYYLITNLLQVISNLKDLQKEIKEYQQEQQEYIQDQLQIIIVILVIINTSCVAIILPLYYYIQKERDAIIYLFTTFPVYKLDNLIKKIQTSYLSTNTNSIYQNQNNQIIVDTIVSLQATENEKNIRKQTKVYQLRSYLLQNIAMHFNVLVMKARPNLKPMKPAIYYDYLYSLIQQQDDISSDIQWVIKSQYSDQRFDQDLYDNFFFSAFKTNLCEDFKKYPQFNTNPKKIDVYLCSQPSSMFLQQGFQVAYKSLFSFFTELYNIYLIPDIRESRKQIRQKLASFNLQEFTAFTEFLDETIISLNDFILTQNTIYYNKIKYQLIALIAFQMVLMVLIFYFGWITFSNYLNNQLHKTKKYLQILDANTLIENQYIQNYIKKNTIA